MAAKSVLLSQETQGTVDTGERRTIVNLPEGSEIALVGQVAGHPEMVEVTWQGQSVWIFAVDFEARTKDDAPPSSRTMAAGAGGSKPEAGISVKAPKETKPAANIGQETVRTPIVRRFNSAGRELF